MIKKKFKTLLFFLVGFLVFSSASSVLAADYTAEYWNTGNVTSPAIPGGAPDLTNTTSTIDFNWGLGSPIGDGNGFIARWTKAETFVAGDYFFSTTSDDGSRVYVDDVLIVNAWVDQGSTTTSNTVAVTAGSHDIRVEYYENTGDAVMQFSYARTDPTATLSPIDDATGIAVGANLVMTFSENVDTEVGADNDIVIYETNGGATVETIDAKDAKITGTGTTTITINPAVTLDEKTEYYIQIGADAFDDSLGNGYSGISDTTSWSFTTEDLTNPTTTLSPLDNATGVAINANLVMTFDEVVDVEAGADNDIVIYKTSGGATVETIDAQDAKITGTGTTTITINPATTLDEQTEYYVKIGADAFDDTSSNSYAGISDTTSWSFTIGDFTDSVISSVTDSSASTTSTITWTTDEISSSQVEYGLTSSYGTITSETDTTPRVTSHSVDLSSLQSCRRYYYRVKSIDGSSNQTISSQSTFSTTGCSVNSISSGTEASITTAAGGSFELSSNNSVAKLVVPSGFASEDADFQINKLNAVSLPLIPDKTTLVYENIFDISAVNNSNVSLTSFDETITFIITYGSDVENSFNENTLDIYKYNISTGSWDDKNCTLDTSANKVTCSLSSFSTYALFGEKSAGAGSSTVSDNDFCSAVVPESSPDLFQIDTTKDTATLYFTPVSRINKYYLSFSKDESAVEYGAELSLSSLGVQSYTVNLLEENQTYYFKVRAQNGCMPGDWSNIKAATTGYQGLEIFVPATREIIEEVAEDEVEEIEEVKKEEVVEEIAKEVSTQVEKPKVERIDLSGFVNDKKEAMAILINSWSSSFENSVQKTKDQIALAEKLEIAKNGLLDSWFVVGEKTQDISEKIGYEIINFGYSFINEPTQIYDVKVLVLSPTEAKISWMTNHPANGKVNYGLDRTYQSDIQSDKLVTSHEFVLENLEADTIYHFEVMSHAKSYVYDANREFKTSER